jgi:hypothetical protein
MDTQLLQKHIEKFIQSSDRKTHQEERDERVIYYQSWTKKKILSMTEDDVYQYISKLWAMLIWGNKHYVVDKIITNNGLENFRNQLTHVIWADDPIEQRWDEFSEKIKGMGSAMISEILCHVHPEEYILWNRRAFVGLNYLGVENLPRYDYQMTGKKYIELANTCLTIVDKLKSAGIADATLLTVDYFIWEELQVEKNLASIHRKKSEKQDLDETKEPKVYKSIHNEVRDKLAEIGLWLGFETNTEIKVADGSVVDTVWEATIGNMGRVIYVFEVQSRGSIDGLILNLLKSMNNPAVQGVVAVSDADQLEKIKKHAKNVGDLHKKLRYWDYEEVLGVHDSLEGVNSIINNLGLVPEGF